MTQAGGPSYTAWIGEGTADLTAGSIGGKGRGLAMLAGTGARVPDAFVVTTACFRNAMTADLSAGIRSRLDSIARRGAGDIEALDAATGDIRALLLTGTREHDGDASVRAAYRQLCARAGHGDVAVAVRSSSAAEDSADRSFAGEHDSYLWVTGEQAVCEHVRRCWASLFTSRAVSYLARDLAPGGGAGPLASGSAMAVVVQRMVDARSAGVLMTLNPANGDRSKVVIESLWGLGEPLVSGTATPDRFTVDKVTGEVLGRQLADKPAEATRDPLTGRGVTFREVPASQRQLPSLSGPEIAELVRLARVVEKAAGCPQDAEFAVGRDGGPDQIFLLQSRPETVWSARPVPAVSPAGGHAAMAHVIATLTKNSQPEGHS
jgi:pyruvate, water dikinase